MRHHALCLIVVAAVSCGKEEPAVNGSDAASPDTGADAAMQTDAASDVAVDSGPDESPDAPQTDAGGPLTNVPFNEAMIAATHNSYSGGTRRTIQEQLEAGVRFVELDVHSDDYLASGYQIGHDAPGDEVEQGEGNPSTIAIADWLAMLWDWHSANPNHVPLTVGLDIKDDIYASPTVADGNLAALNQLVEQTFGDALLTEAEVADGWPLVDELRGRILVVLSGSTSTRLGYRRTIGANPAVADDGGRVLVAHEGDGDVVVWSGSREEFLRYERIPGVQDPAIDVIGDDVLLVAVAGGALQWRHGTLNAEHSISWSGPLEPFPDASTASNPSVRFQGSRDVVRQTHEDPNGAPVTWEGQWDAGSGAYVWAAVVPAEDRFDETTSTGAAVAQTQTEAYADVLTITLDGATRRVRPAQRMFSESQFSGPVEFESDGVMMFAANQIGGDFVAWAETKRAAGGVVRLWKFNLPNILPEPPPNYPATDQPFADWYQSYCARCAR